MGTECSKLSTPRKIRSTRKLNKLRSDSNESWPVSGESGSTVISLKNSLNS